MKPEVFDKTIIVWEGKPYMLLATQPGYTGNVCKECDLKELCMGAGYEYRFRELCCPDEGDAPYRFVENWNHIDLPFFEVIESQREYVAQPDESKFIQSDNEPKSE